MGVQISDRISQLTGRTLYWPAAAIFLASVRLGRMFMALPPCAPESCRTVRLGLCPQHPGIKCKIKNVPDRRKISVKDE